MPLKVQTGSNSAVAPLFSNPKFQKTNLWRDATSDSAGHSKF
jgi:hypothetical protein